MEGLYCGFAQADITPEAPKTVYLDGYGYREKPAEGVRDKIWAKVCYLRAKEKEFAVVALDVCGLNNELNEKLRRYVRLFTDMQDDDFVLCSTHTHAAPVCGVLRDLPINYLYWNRVGECVAAAVAEAKKSACRGSFRFAWGTPLQTSYNRRGQQANIDKRVHICGFYDEKGELRGAIASASCHAVCIQSYLISADYPSVLYARAEKEYPGIPFLFLQGRGADVDPLIEGERRKEAVREAALEQLGRELADGVFSSLAKMNEGGFAKGTLVSRAQTLSVPLICPEKEWLLTTRREMFEICMRSVESYEGEKRYAAVEMQWCDEMLHRLEKGDSTTVEAKVQLLFAKEEFAFAFVPFELLTETGNAIEELLTETGISAEKCFVVGYCNGVNGYLVPSSESQKEGYETKSSAHWYHLPGEYDERAERLLLDSVKEMLRESKK